MGSLEIHREANTCRHMQQEGADDDLMNRPLDVCALTQCDIQVHSDPHMVCPINLSDSLTELPSGLSQEGVSDPDPHINGA